MLLSLRSALQSLQRWWTGLTQVEFPDRQVRIRLRQPLVLAAGVLALGWHLAFPSGQAAMLLAAWLGLVLLAYLWVRQMARRVRAERKLLSAALQVGDELEERVALHNESGLPVLWAEFIDRSNLPGHTVAGVNALEGRGRVEWKAAVICQQRGLFTLGPWELRLGDPFGIFAVEQVYPQREEVLVYPPLAPLPAALLPRGRMQGDQAPLRRMLGADTVSAASVRAYQPGDPLRWIHWPTTARRGTFFSRLFDPEALSVVWLIPDLHPAAHLGEGNESSLEVMVVLLASLGEQLLRARRAVGLLALGAQPQVIAPRAGPAALWPLLRGLAQVQADSPWPLAEMLPRAGELISRRSLYLLVTAETEGGWLDALHTLANRPGGQAGQVLLLDPESFGGEGSAEPLAGLLRGQGFAAEVVRREEVRPIRGVYGALRRWEYLTLGTGRIVVRQRPREAEGAAQ